MYGSIYIKRQVWFPDIVYGIATFQLGTQYTHYRMQGSLSLNLRIDLIALALSCTFSCVLQGVSGEIAFDFNNKWYNLTMEKRPFWGPYHLGSFLKGVINVIVSAGLFILWYYSKISESRCKNTLTVLVRQNGKVCELQGFENILIDM